MAKFCGSCGAGLEDAVNFCVYCGKQCAAFAPPVRQPAPQQAYPPQPPVQPLSEKQQVLLGAPQALNLPGQPWEARVVGDSIVARWKWEDGNSFHLFEVTNEIKEYTFTVTLFDNRTWREADKSEEKEKGAKWSGGTLSLGKSANSFSGKQSQKSFSLGKKDDGQLGMVCKFDTALVKEPIRAYLTSRGWKKAGLFG